MSILELVQKYGKGLGEGKMWQSVSVLSEALEPMKESDKNGYWCIMRKMYGVISDGHYNEEFAMYDASQIEYTNRQGEKKYGAYWSVEQVEEATKGFIFPNGVNKWDKWVAFNAAYADFCKKFDDAQILEIGYLFYFADEDWRGRNKIWEYTCLNYSL